MSAGLFRDAKGLSFAVLASSFSSLSKMPLTNIDAIIAKYRHLGPRNQTCAPLHGSFHRKEHHRQVLKGARHVSFNSSNLKRSKRSLNEQANVFRKPHLFAIFSQTSSTSPYSLACLRADPVVSVRVALDLLLRLAGCDVARIPNKPPPFSVLNMYSTVRSTSLAPPPARAARDLVNHDVLSSVMHKRLPFVPAVSKNPPPCSQQSPHNTWQTSPCHEIAIVS